MRIRFEALCLCVIAVAVLLGGCHSASALPPAASSASLARIDPLAQKIDHIIIVVQENRSFNNLFYGFPGAKTVKFGYDSKNQKVVLRPIGLKTSWDVEHNSQAFYAGCHGTGTIPGTDCRMNGFDKVTVQCSTPGFPKCPIKYPAYSYVPHGDTAPYFAMGKQYVLADEMYASNFDISSYVSHQYIIAGWADHTTNYPYTLNWGCPGGPGDMMPTITEKPPRGYGPNVVVCFNYKTLADELDEKKLSWAFYANELAGAGPSGTTCGTGGMPDPAPTQTPYPESGIWSSYQAIKHICHGPDWDNDVFSPPQQFLTDVSSGKLRDVTWITPTCPNSDHPGCNSDTGPSWVASIVNAVGESKFWDTSAIFIFWDDPGGFFDPMPPKYLDYDGLGFRIPLLIISPYAKKGWVSHVHYEHGSILKFIEHRFGLQPLEASDARANSPEQDAFDFNQPPRKFKKIEAKYDLDYFLRQPPDYRPVDTN